jgi:CRISPR-associated exonuclease Cas4
MLLLLLLVVLVLISAAAYVGLGAWASRERRQLGLGERRVESADDSQLGSPTLRSERLGLVARPDHVLEADGTRIPLEQKPYARRVWPSHVLQVAAQCAVLEDTWDTRPPHGVVLLAGGAQEQVAFTPELEQRLLETMQEMRQILATDQAPGPCWSRGKCAACGFREICWGAAWSGARPCTSASSRGTSADGRPARDTPPVHRRGQLTGGLR